jgi:hypothetical protein
MAQKYDVDEITTAFGSFTVTVNVTVTVRPPHGLAPIDVVLANKSARIFLNRKRARSPSLQPHTPTNAGVVHDAPAVERGHRESKRRGSAKSPVEQPHTPIKACVFREAPAVEREHRESKIRGSAKRHK